SYFPLYALVVGYLARIFNFSAINAMFVFSVIIQVLASIAIFLLCKEIFNDKKIALLTAILANGLVLYPIVKYLGFTRFLLYPLFFLFLIKYLKNQNYKNAIITGVLYGLNSISHGSAFLTLTLLFPFFFIFIFLRENVSIKGFAFKKNEFFSDIRMNILTFVLIFLIGFSIAQVYWFTPLTNFGNLPNKLTEYAQMDYSRLSVQYYFIKNHIIKNIFFNFKRLSNSIVSLLSIFAVFSLIFIKTGDYIVKEAKKLIVFFSLSFLIVALHFLITVPILGIEFSPHYMAAFFNQIIKVFFVGFSLTVLFKLGFVKKIKYLFYVLVILLVIFSIIDFNSKIRNDRWIQAGFQELNPVLLEAADAIKERTDLDEHFISTKEIGSAINALTGRKFLSIRRNQHPVTSYVDERELDLAVILYSNNNSNRNRAIKKWDIDYLYWDLYWFNSEFQFDKQGKLLGYFDPIMLVYTEEREQILDDNNISYKKENLVMDPSKRGDEKIQAFDVLVVFPSQMNMTHPWHPGLDEYLDEIWSFEAEGVKVAGLFKIKN
ncbi:hypothetical protein KY312_04655, partial [Candidatus Woesearchaeota archaeon]|nr:hypothetical protein [Candidatus Woesearchaeota archaeon]